MSNNKGLSCILF